MTAVTTKAKLATLLLMLVTIGGIVIAVRYRRSPDDSQPATKTARLVDPAEFEAPLGAALEKALEATRTRPDDAQAWGDLGRLCHAHGLHSEAREAYRKAQALDPQDSLWPHLLGLVCDVLSLPDEALDAFSRSVEMEPFDVVSRCALARIHQSRGEDDRARELLVEAVKVDSKSVAARVQLGQLAFKAGVLDMAEKHLKLALEGYPRCGPAHSALAQLYDRQGKAPEAEFHRRWSLACGGLIPLPNRYMEEIERLGVSHAARMKRGNTAAEKGDWHEALRNFRAAVELRPELAEPRYYLGVSLIRTGDIEAGVKELQQVTEGSEKRIDAWLRIAAVRAGQQNWDASLAAITAALKVDPNSPDALIARGNFYRRKDERELARADYDRVLAIDPEHATAHMEKGRLLNLRGAKREDTLKDAEVRKRERERAAAALQSYERALALQPDLADAYGGSGRTHMQLWEFAELPADKEKHIAAAIVRFRQHVRYFPEVKRGHVALIRALYSAGRTKESVAAIHRAAERWPEDPMFRRKR